MDIEEKRWGRRDRDRRGPSKRREESAKEIEITDG